MSGQAKPAGRLSLKLIQAIGKAEDDKSLWDDSFQQGFVKAELRATSKNVKAQSTINKVSEGTIQWDEELTLDMPADATELRLMLCKEKRYATRTGAAVVAACGLFVQPLLAAVPIDKHFDMYKPSGAGPGGQIHIIADYDAFEDDKDWDTHPGHLPALAEESGDGKRLEPAAQGNGPDPAGSAPAADAEAANGTAAPQAPAGSAQATEDGAPGGPSPAALAAQRQTGSAQGLPVSSIPQKPAAGSSRAAGAARSQQPQQPRRKPRRARLLLAAVAIGAAAVVVARKRS